MNIDNGLISFKSQSPSPRELYADWKIDPCVHVGSAGGRRSRGGGSAKLPKSEPLAHYGD